MVSFHFGIKQKFVSLAFFLLFCVSLFIFIFFPLRQEVQMSDYLLQKVFVISDIVSHGTTAAILFDDLPAVNSYLKVLNTLEEVQFAILNKKDEKGYKVFADYQSANSTQKSNRYSTVIRDLLEKNERDHVNFDDITIAAVPIESDGEKIGRAIIGVTRRNLNRDVMQSRLVAMIVGISVLLLGSMVFLWQTNRIVKPLLSLEKASRKVADGDMNVEVTTTSTDEVGVLAKAFNLMVANIRSSMEEIRNKNTALIMQQEVIEEFNKRLTDSIQYGKRIQGAILPDSEAITTALKNSQAEHFVLFRPKDVVSGDFYWFSNLDNKVFFAVVDCTGHGVPGAFMSMIGNTLLNEIVNQKKITDPAKALDLLNAGVRHALKQENDNMLSKDGMEVAMVVIEGNMVTFAGAGRPLFIRYKDKPVERIKGDRQAIGGKLKDSHTSFTSKQIPVESGLLVYITSDGYIDQNNEKGKKLGTKGLEDLIEKVYALSISEQEQVFATTLDEHQGSADQRDDITLVGIKFQ